MVFLCIIMFIAFLICFGLALWKDYDEPAMRVASIIGAALAIFCAILTGTLAVENHYGKEFVKTLKEFDIRPVDAKSYTDYEKENMYKIYTLNNIYYYDTNSVELNK